MSRQNKVNPGMYTQRGRLTQDDAARELRKQSAFGSPPTWHPVNARATPRFMPAGGAAPDTESADNQPAVATSSRVKARPASRVTRNTRATKATPTPRAGTSKAKTAKKRTAGARKSKQTIGKGKSVMKGRPARSSKTAARATKRAPTKRRKVAK